MSTTNLTPVQGLVPQTAEALEEKLWQVEMEIHDLDQKIKEVESKVHLHYQERLMALCHTCKTLEAKITSMRAEEIPRAPMPSVPPLQDLLGPEAAAVPAEPEMLGASPPRISRSPSLQEGSQLGSEAEVPTEDMGVDVLSLEEGSLVGQQIQESQA